MTTQTERLTLDGVEHRMTELNAEVQQRYSTVTAITTRAQDEYRDLNEAEKADMRAETTKLAALRAEIEGLEQTSLTLQVQQRSAQIGDAIARATGRETRRGHSPLVVSDAHLRSHAEAIRAGSVFGAVEDLAGELHTRAKVTAATDMGSPGDWGSPAIPGPVTLRAFANIPNTPLTGATAQMPSLTLPAGAAGVVESNAHGEFDAVDVANLTTLRYGRWSEVTSFVDEFDTLDALNQAHAVGIARDLNLLDATAIITAAGAVTAFSASALDLNVRAAILKVAAATLSEPEDVVLFGSSAALAVVNGYAPASGGDRGSVTTWVFGARVYVHEPTTAGNVYAFNPAAFRVFSSRLRSASVIDPTTGGNKFGQWLHSTGPGVGVVGGAAGVDVVTP